jgi:hypothetical protein
MTSARNLGGTTFASLSTASIGNGTTFRRVFRGTFVSAHGLLTKSRSLIAARNTELTTPCNTWTVEGASGEPLTHACLSLGRTEASWRWPNAGYACLRNIVST